MDRKAIGQRMALESLRKVNELLQHGSRDEICDRIGEMAGHVAWALKELGTDEDRAAYERDMDALEAKCKASRAQLIEDGLLDAKYA